MQRLVPAIPLVFVLVWSTGFIGAKFGLPYIEPFHMLELRFLIVIPILLCAAVVLRRWRMSLRAALGQIAVGVLLHGWYLCGVFQAIALGVPAGTVALIVGLQPVLTAALGWAFLGQRLRGVQLTGLALGFAGMTLVILGAGQGGGVGHGAGGIAAALVALVGISLGTVLQKRVGARTPLLAGTAMQYLGALMLALCLSLLFETRQVVHDPVLYLTMAWLVFGLSILAILLLMVMIRAGQVARVAAHFYLVPPVTLVQGWLFFDERLGVVSALGTVVTVAGVWLVLRTPSALSARGADLPSGAPVRR